jgi:putative membrane protein
MVRLLATTAIVAVGLLSAPAVIAQTSPAGPPGAAAPSTSAQHMLSTQGREFVDKAGHGGLAEIELSKLAQKSANPDVRRFADRMIEDHTKIGQRLATIASADGVTAPTTLDSEHQQLRDKLANLHGGVFDREYARVMVDDHNQAIKLFQQEARSGQDAALKAFARNTLPTLQEHRRMAVALSRKLAQTAAE